MVTSLCISKVGISFQNKERKANMRLVFLVMTVATWLEPSVSFQPVLQVTTIRNGRVPLKSSDRDLHEFDFLLSEGSETEFQKQQIQRQQNGYTRRRIQTSASQDQKTVMASTTFAGPGLEEEVSISETQEGEADPYVDLFEDNSRVQQYQLQGQSKPTLESRLKNMDLQDIVSTLIIPSIIAFAGLRWGFNRVAERVSNRVDATLDSFANEMIYHDGDFEEMKLCFNDYTKKLVWLGPRKTQAMLKRYLQLYSKKKTVSPQSISLFKLSEEKAAQILVSLCRQMGEGKISSAGKLLFFGNRILKSPEGKAALIPIRDMIKGSYREFTVAEAMVETSQQAMAEAAYKTAVQAGGKNQSTLTVGWEVLGLDKETAVRIFEEEAKEGFISDREKMYGGQTRKYDAKGNIIDKEGKLVDPENAIGGSDSDAPTSNVYECGDCGYTLFIAKGREDKFFGEGFKCPQCGAAKDKFKPKDIDEDD